MIINLCGSTKDIRKKSFTTWTVVGRLRVFNPLDYFVECWNAKNFAATQFDRIGIKNRKMSDDNFEFILFLEFLILGEKWAWK